MTLQSKSGIVVVSIAKGIFWFGTERKSFIVSPYNHNVSLKALLANGGLWDIYNSSTMQLIGMKHTSRYTALVKSRCKKTSALSESYIAMCIKIDVGRLTGNHCLLSNLTSSGIILYMGLAN